METSTCKKCVGGGLIGAGEFPHLKQGAVSTCDMCGGSGKVATQEVGVEATEPVVETAPEPEVVPEVSEVPTEEKKSEDSSEVGSDAE